MLLVFTAKKKARNQVTTWSNSSVLKSNTQYLWEQRVTFLPHGAIPSQLFFSSPLLQYDCLILDMMSSLLACRCKDCVHAMDADDLCINYLSLTTWSDPQDIHLLSSAGKSEAQPKATENPQAKQYLF